MGRILFEDFEQLRYFPRRFCQASLLYGLMGKEHASPETLLASFVGSLGTDEGAVVRSAITASESTSEIQEDLIEILGRCDVRQLPSATNERG